MERVVQAIAQLITVVVQFFASLLQQLAASFGVDIPSADAQIIVVLVILALIVRRFVYQFGKFESIKPQKIVLTTSKTPLEILFGDLSGCLTIVFLVVLVIGLGWVVGQLALGG